jgi:hypothetical protein
MNEENLFNSGNTPKDGKSLESQLTPAQKETWENIKQGFIELKLAEEGKVKFRPIQELLDELSEDEEDAYLLAAMEEVKDEKPASDKEVQEFKRWLKSSVKE